MSTPLSYAFLLGRKTCGTTLTPHTHASPPHRFPHRLEKLFDWLDVEGLDLDKSKLVRNRPRAVFTHPDSNPMTVEDAGLAGQVLLFIEPR